MALKFFYKYQTDGSVQGIYQVMEARYKYNNPMIGRQLTEIDATIADLKRQLQVIDEYDFIEN